MKIELNKLYLIIDQDMIIQRGYIQFTEKPEHGKAYCIGFNSFDVEHDFDNAIIVEGINFNDIVFGKSTYKNGIFEKGE